MQYQSKYIIIGAGLSGLTTAQQLIKQGESDFIILEARNRIGGRIHTKDSIDLGATWFQEHHAQLSALLNELDLQKYNQFSIGKSVLVYNTMAPAHYFESDASAPQAQRIKGGSISIIDKLAEGIKDKIKINTRVTSILELDNLISVETENENFKAEKVIVTLPPKLAGGINFSPALPDEVLEVMNRTHTWMSNAIKVGLTFEKAFWRSKGMSGTVIGQVGPVIELYDHVNHEENTFSLMGFVNEALRDESAANRKERILSYLEKYLGSEIRNYVEYYEKDWSADEFTSCQDLKSIYMSPQYGNPVFQKTYYNHKLLFSGAETSPEYGGYMEGAVISGLGAVELLR